jgi:uroporphyrinogen-III decarboxylase
MAVSGPFTHPDWYRRNVFKHYNEYWKAVHDAGKKVIYCSDGDFNLVIDDIAQAGCDGFIFEPSTSFKYICQRYGKIHVIVGNADCRKLQFGNKDDIVNEIERCLTAGRNCPGYFFCFSNHLLAGIQIENIIFAMEYFENNSQR